MKLKKIDLTKPRQVDSIREGQMFQIHSNTYGTFKSAAFRSEENWLYFKDTKGDPVYFYFVDELMRLDYLAK